MLAGHISEQPLGLGFGTEPVFVGAGAHLVVLRAVLSSLFKPWWSWTGGT